MIESFHWRERFSFLYICFRKNGNLFIWFTHTYKVTFTFLFTILACPIAVVVSSKCWKINLELCTCLLFRWGQQFSPTLNNLVKFRMNTKTHTMNQWTLALRRESKYRQLQIYVLCAADMSHGCCYPRLSDKNCHLSLASWLIWSDMIKFFILSFTRTFKFFFRLKMSLVTSMIQRLQLYSYSKRRQQWLVF